MPDDIVTLSRDQSNAIRENHYISQKTVTIKPSRNDRGRILECIASHPLLQNNLQLSVHLNVHVLPSSMLLFVPNAEGHQEHGTRSRSLYINENATTSITCKALGSFPATKLQWYFPDGNITIINNTETRSVVSDDNLFDTESTITILTGKNDHGQYIQCNAYMDVNIVDQAVSRLMVLVWPKNVLLFPTGSNQSQSTAIYVQEDLPTSITCKSVGSFPAVDLSFPHGSDIIPITNSSKTSSLSHEKLFDTETTIKIRPTKTDHGKNVQCNAFMDNEVVGLNISKLRVYGLPDDVNITIPVDLQDGIETLVTCRTSNGYPAPLIHWYIGSRNLTDSSSLKSSLNRANRYDSVSTLIFVPKSFIAYVSSTLTINSAIPDPPSWLIVEQTQTTSSTLFVAWQPGFDGGFQQTFNLEYCPNDTLAKEEECGVITNLTQPLFRLDDLNPFTWYRLTMWSENSAGNSSMETTVVSTAPLQPENYGVTVTRVKEWRVLQLSKANQSLDEICFILLKTFQTSDCPLVNDTKCNDPGTEIRIDPGDDVVVVTYGRGLCSEPADIQGEDL
nr:uncharacterized protein LOC129267188 [Lytechinus pictus]